MTSTAARRAEGGWWIHPIDPATYDRRALLPAERQALAYLAEHRGNGTVKIRSTLDRLLQPIDDVLDHADAPAWARSPTRGALMLAMARNGQAFWGWDGEAWAQALRATNVDARQFVAVIAYVLCDERGLHHEIPQVKTNIFVRRVFGAEPVSAAVDDIARHFGRVGAGDHLASPAMQWALYEWMLAAGSPRLADLATRPDIVHDQHARERSNPRRHGIERIARSLVDMGMLTALPFRLQPTREEWLHRSSTADNGVDPAWQDWIRRWYTTTTLSKASRRTIYYSMIKLGRWLARDHPDVVSPQSWTRALAAEWVAAVDQMLVGELSRAPNTYYMRDRSGGQLKPRTKAGLLNSTRTFFADLQDWEWIERRFDPRRALAVPRSVASLIGPDPRVIADDVWAKLMWAGLNLTEDDLPARTLGDVWYPIELVRAVTMLWLFAGLRRDEIRRLPVGAVRWQSNGEEDLEVCLLHVPINKTSTTFTKPVDRLVGTTIEAWQAIRPAQAALPDDKTGDNLHFLFAYRGTRIGRAYINNGLIPILCEKAGVPLSDVRGRITSHRARATIASQLYNAKDPMTLFELQAWLGHRTPNSTQHYARITPTTLTKAYTDAGYFARNVRAIEVLLDRDAILHGNATAGEPFEYYDLGHGYCTYSFFEQCPHRMACARCDFCLPKHSTLAGLLEAKNNLQRMAVEIPLTDDERAAVDGDTTAVNHLIEQLDTTPTPAGPTPRELAEHSSTLQPSERAVPSSGMDH